MGKCALVILFFVIRSIILVDISYCQNETTKEPNKLGVGAYFGVGVFIPSDNKFVDAKTELYPELGIFTDLYGIQAGLSFGYTYQGYTYQRYNTYYDRYYPQDVSHSFVPVLANIKLYPMKFFQPDFLVQPYGGLGIGLFIPVGDNDESVFAISGRIGADINLIEYVIPYIDLKYTSATHESHNDGGIFITVGIAGRITF